mmetsp:Transcript_20488/g.28207  ORF Transcript_20488/g.28207 Transcript_20488/m.28207 type:complete len:279 (+) Transcript_20488:140-976(+)
MSGASMEVENENDDSKKKRSRSSKTPKPGKKRTTDKNYPWPHIEGLGNAISLKSKIVVSMRPRDFENPQLMITYAQDIFLQTFSISRETLKYLPFDSITGPATPRDSLYAIKNAILTETAVNQYINLYRSNGVPLSCHLSVASIAGKANPSQSNPLNNDADANKTKWAVVTVTSASSIGNSKHNGIGILGIDRVSISALNQIGCKGSKAKAKREAATVELNELLKSNQLFIGHNNNSSSNDNNNELQVNSHHDHMISNGSHNVVNNLVNTHDNHHLNN